MDQVDRVLPWLADVLGPLAARAAGALLIILVAAVASRIARASVRRLGASGRLDERLRFQGLSAILADCAFWGVWLFALPMFLSAVELDSVLGPVNAVIAGLLGFIPRLIGSAIIFGVGFLIAKILREAVTRVLTAAGSEKIAARLGLSSALGTSGLAGLAGTLVFVLTLLPMLAAALQPLGLESVTTPVSRMLETVTHLIPKLVSSAIILVVAAIAGRSIANITTTLLAGLGFNKVPAQLGFAEGATIGGRDASQLGGRVVMIAVLILALIQVFEILGFAVMTEAVTTFAKVLVQVAIAGAMLAVGLWLSSVASIAIRGSTLPNGAVVGAVVRALILFFTAALAMRQAGLPAEIIAIAFGFVLGAACIGIAIAFGIGGRHVAGRLAEKAVASFSRKDQA